MRKLLPIMLIPLLLSLNQASASWVFSISGKYLYWTAHQEIQNLHLHKVPKAHYPWNPGFRIGMDVTLLEFLCLKPGIEYTHFQTHKKKERGTVLDFGKLPTIQTIKDDFVISSSADPKDKNEVSVCVNYVDLNLFGNSRILYCITLDWGLGLRGAILRSNWHNLAQFNDNELERLNTEKTKADWKYCAAGGKFNVEVACEVGSGFKLYQEVTGAWLWGNLKHFAKTSIQDLDFDVDKSRFKSVPVIHSETGITWSFCCEVCALLQAKIAFEYSKWFHVGENAFFVNSDDARFKNSRSDLILSGITAGLSIEF